MHPVLSMKMQNSTFLLSITVMSNLTYPLSILKMSNLTHSVSIGTVSNLPHSVSILTLSKLTHPIKQISVNFDSVKSETSIDKMCQFLQFAPIDEQTLPIIGIILLDTDNWIM